MACLTHSGRIFGLTFILHRYPPVCRNIRNMNRQSIQMHASTLSWHNDRPLAMPSIHSPPQPAMTCIASISTSQTLSRQVSKTDYLKRMKAVNWTKKLAEDAFIDPVKELQSYVATPILSDNEKLFTPSDEAVKEGEGVFQSVKLIKSVASLDKLPDENVPEVAVIGKSNVGKSSLLQALFSSTPNIVKTGKKPGQTQTLNFFDVDGKFRLVDVPGFGYNMPANYHELVEGYLTSRKNLCRTLCLKSGSTRYPVDKLGKDMISEMGIPYVIVLTKIDRFSPHLLLKTFLETKQTYIQTGGNCFPQLFVVSSLTGAGIPFLQTFIAHITGNLKSPMFTVQEKELAKESPSIFAVY
ncbi:GTP-binding protein 8 isoform X1 [Lingula anatina]|uniref:GTP-binding protein 8 n=2 Tax=Lingula anatina TaxID=7574 RepID=A0A1S3KEH8_LINAN|nr:GTP-binding protein 8 isoform X1 [Lingula anatina]|eukprot:XP_013421035.1 GTP-binding protein 8 isoform X1 [Lingula anatina]